MNVGHDRKLRGTGKPTCAGCEVCGPSPDETNKVAKTITGVMGPHNVQIAPDGKTVWATSGHADEVVVIDTATYQVRERIIVGKEPAHVVLTPDGRLAYVTNENDKGRSLRSPLHVNMRRALDPPGALPVFSNYRSDGAERFDSYQARLSTALPSSDHNLVPN